MSLVSTSDIEPEELQRALRAAQQKPSEWQFPGRFLLRGDQRSSSDLIVSHDQIRPVPDLPDSTNRPIHPELQALQQRSSNSVQFNTKHETIRRARMFACPVRHEPALDDRPCALLGTERKINLEGRSDQIRLMTVGRNKRGGIDLQQRLIKRETLLPGGSRTAPPGWHQDLDALDALERLTPGGLLEEVILSVTSSLGHRTRILAATIAAARSGGQLRVAWALTQSNTLISEVVLANHPIWPELSGELQRESLQAILRGQNIGPVLQRAAARTLEERDRPIKQLRAPVWRTPLETWSHSDRYRTLCGLKGLQPVTWNLTEGTSEFTPAVPAPDPGTSHRRHRKT